MNSAPLPVLRVLLSELSQGSDKKRIYAQPAHTGLFFLADNPLKVEIAVRNQIGRSEREARDRKNGEDSGTAAVTS